MNDSQSIKYFLTNHSAGFHFKNLNVQMRAVLPNSKKKRPTKEQVKLVWRVIESFKRMMAKVYVLNPFRRKK